MDRNHPFPNTPGRYDKARIGRLRSVEEAIKRLRLPVGRSRKLLVILSALEVQIEDGGDSPEVNRRLLEALRAGVHHQMADSDSEAALRAIDAFERAEAERWEQVRTGTLPPIVLSPEEQLDDLMQQGYDLLDAGQRSAACDRWLEAWELVKRLRRPEWRTTEAFDRAHPGGAQLVFNWCQDLEMELSNAGLDAPVHHEHRLRYAQEFPEQFPDEDTLFQLNFSRAVAEALWNLGRRSDAEAAYQALVQRFPDEAWSYIAWADRYWFGPTSTKQYEWAKAILERGLARANLNHRDHLLERLDRLYDAWGKSGSQAAGAAQREELRPRHSSLSAPPRTGSMPLGTPKGTAPPPAKKPSRNDPCSCGSGKKYKKCCGR